MTCIPSFDACAAEHDGHYCDGGLGHAGVHSCSCEPNHEWPVDRALESARAAYVAFYSTRYIDEAHTPSSGAVTAACTPLDSPWRAVGQAVARVLGVTL